MGSRRSPPVLGVGTRESGENPELPRSGIGNENGLEALVFQAHARKGSWEAVVSRSGVAAWCPEPEDLARGASTSIEAWFDDL